MRVVLLLMRSLFNLWNESTFCRVLQRTGYKRNDSNLQSATWGLIRNKVYLMDKMRINNPPNQNDMSFLYLDVNS